METIHFPSHALLVWTCDKAASQRSDQFRPATLCTEDDCKRVIKDVAESIRGGNRRAAHEARVADLTADPKASQAETSHECPRS